MSESISIVDVLPFTYADNSKNYDFFRRIEEMCGSLRQAIIYLTNPRFQKIFSRQGFELAYEEQVRIYHLGLGQTNYFARPANEELKDKYFADVAEGVFHKLTGHKMYFNLNAFKLFLSLPRRKYLSEYGRN